MLTAHRKLDSSVGSRAQGAYHPSTRSPGRGPVQPVGAGAERGLLVDCQCQLQALVTDPDYHCDEDKLLSILSSGHRRALELKKATLTDQRTYEESRQLAQEVLNVCYEWFRLAASGQLIEGSEGLRGVNGTELACASVALIIGVESRLASSMTASYLETCSLGLFGRAICHFEEPVLVGAVRKLRQVAGRCGAQARREGSTSMSSLQDNIESFRSSLFARLREIAARSNRKLRVGNFKELVGELGGVLSSLYGTTQVFEMGCLLSMQLTTELACWCPGVPESDALEAVEWMASVLKNLLDQTSSSGALASPVAVREWLDDSGLWSTLLRRAGSRTQHHAHHLVAVLLTRRALAPCDLVGALASAGALSPALSSSLVPTPSRLAIQGALLAAVPSLGAEAILDLFGELCGALGFAHLSEEGIELLVRLTLRAFSAGYDPVGPSLDSGLGRSLALSHLLRYLQWGYRQVEPPEQLLECARRALLHSLAPQPVLAPLLPALASEALALAAAPSVGAPDFCLGHCVRSLGMFAVDVASANAAAVGTNNDAAARLSEEATVKLCSVLPPINSSADPPFSHLESQAWTESFVDALSCYLRLPSAHIATAQVGVLWGRFIMRPIYGLSITAAAMQYFKLAFLASSSAGVALLSPLNASPNQLPEVRLAYASIFSPASFQEDPPPLPMSFFFPEVTVPAQLQQPEADVVGAIDLGGLRDSGSPPRIPQVLRRSISSAPDFDNPEAFFGDNVVVDEAAVEAAAEAANVEMPHTSANAPRLRLDRVQHEQSATLFGELTVYDAIERRLWDEFDERGRVDDGEALRQRDAAARRCLAALDQEIDGAGYAQVELAPPLTEARAKFSALCKLIAGRAAELTGQELQEAEVAFAEAEEELVSASTTQRRAVMSSRRRGMPPPPPAEVAAARTDLSRAHMVLIAALRRVAMRAQLGLVEVIGTEGLGRALRAAGKSHGDPLLENLQRHGRWAAAQAACDAKMPEMRGRPTVGLGPSLPAPLEDSVLARPDGLLGYTDLRELSQGRVLSARRQGAPVALKAHSEGRESSFQRELEALRTLQHPSIVALQGAFRGGNSYYLELAWCAGGPLNAWCDQHPGIVGTEDVEAFVKCLGIFRQAWLAIAHIHSCGAVHGDISLENFLLTADHRPVLADFERCLLGGSGLSHWRGAPPPSPDYMAPELEDQGSESPVPTEAADIYAAGATMAKAFLGTSVMISSYPYHPTRGQRCLPDERTDVDLADLIQLALSLEPSGRPVANAAAAHRALDPAHFLRRRGLLGSSSRGRAAAEVLLSKAEHLFQEYRGRRVDEPLMFARDQVFDAISQSRVGEWSEEALLGEWRVMLSDESGVDGGGLRREVVSLFFEQFEQSSLVMRTGADAPGMQPTLFIGDRQKADRSPQQWRQMWTAVGAMILRAVVHFGNAPVSFSSAVFDCAFGRIGKLPPDDTESMGMGESLLRLREQRGDEWARSELLDMLRRLRCADAQKEAGYRWMLAQRVSEAAGTYVMTADAVDTIGAMLEQPSYQFLIYSSDKGIDGSISHDGAVMEWALLWDIYLKYLGGGDRWLAYEALVDGLTARGRCSELWAPLTGAQLADALEGAPLTPDAVVANLEFKPSYGYDTQIHSFRHVVESFSADELSMFLRFATGIGRLPANRRFPKGQKLTVRFMPDHLDRLPSAHTCFWVVDLPPYEDENDMAEKLRQAIAAPQPFALS